MFYTLFFVTHINIFNSDTFNLCSHKSFLAYRTFKKNNTWYSNVVPHRSTNRARRCLTSLSRREAVLSPWYGRSCRIQTRVGTCIVYANTSSLEQTRIQNAIFAEHRRHFCIGIVYAYTSSLKSDSYSKRD